MFEPALLEQSGSGQRRTIVTKAKILREAAVIFATQGFSGASLRAIAAAAEVKQPVINYHFDSKQNLWIAVVTHLFSNFREFGEPIRIDPSRDAAKQFASHVYSIMDYTARFPYLFQIIQRESLNNDSLLDLVKPQLQEWSGFTRRYYRELQQAGICEQIPLDDFQLIFRGAMDARFIYKRDTMLVSGVNPDDPKLIKSYADSLVKIFLGSGSSA